MLIVFSGEFYRCGGWGYFLGDEGLGIVLKVLNL